jgi:two-component sensor histidine kinase
VFSSAPGMFSEHIDRLRAVAQRWRSWGGAAIAVASIGAAALIFDAVTPQIISVGMFYVGVVLIGFWFPNPKAALVLALLATPLIIVGYWITIPDNTTAWEAWLNRALAVGTVWMTAVFVWHIRVLEQKLQGQIDIANTLSSEMNHRVGNHLQLVSSFLRLQARGSCNEDLRRALELASSRVMVIGNIQRMLSHSSPSHKIESRTFIMAIIHELRSALPDTNQVDITVHADSAKLTSTTATAIGALFLELINNALKHAFPDGMKGVLTVSFTVSNNNYIAEFKDDGIGIAQGQAPDGFGTRSVADIARLMGGSLTCQPARQSSTRPGTMWRLVIPA